MKPARVVRPEDRKKILEDLHKEAAEKSGQVLSKSTLGEILRKDS